jgi:hypothetical protein
MRSSDIRRGSVRVVRNLWRVCGSVRPRRSQGRAQVERLAEEVQQITGRSVELAYVDQGYVSRGNSLVLGA